MISQDWKEALSGLAVPADPSPTDPNTEPQEYTEIEQPARKQRLVMRMERKGRGGKTVTIIAGYIGTDEELEAFATRLKQRCGVGGSVKDGEIIIQGDHRERLRTLLVAEGMQVRG